MLHDLSLSGAPRMALQVFQTLAQDVDARVLSLDDGPLRAPFQEIGPTRTLLEGGPQRLQNIAAKMESRLPGVRGAVVRVNGYTQSRVLRKWQPDLIYINSLISLHFGRYLNLPDVPALLHVHETGTALHAHRLAVPQLFASWPTRYVAVSQHTKRCLVEEGVAPEKIVVVPNFLSSSAQEELRLLSAKRPRKAPDEPFVVGGAGQISWTKGPELWLLMAAELRRLLGERVRFKWIGGRNKQEDKLFEWMAKQLGIAEQLELVPTTPHPFEQYATLDALAFTSWEDSFGLVVLENMALGNLVTCFAEGGGAPEVVGDAGLVIPQFSPTNMAEALAQTLNDTKKRERLGHASMERASTFGGEQLKTAMQEVWLSATKNF